MKRVSRLASCGFASMACCPGKKNGLSEREETGEEPYSRGSVRGRRGVYSAGSWTWIFAPEPSISAVGSIGFFLQGSPRALGCRIDGVCGTGDYPLPDLARETTRGR